MSHKTMTLEEFDSRHRSVGRPDKWLPWLQEIPRNVPVPVPESLLPRSKKLKSASAGVRRAAQKGRDEGTFSGTVRTIQHDGALWVVAS